MSDHVNEHTPKTSGVKILSLDAIFESLTELQDSVNELQTVVSTIDTSPNSALNKKVGLVEATMNNLVLNVNTLGARLTALESKVDLLGKVTPVTPVEVPETPPSFITLLVRKFTQPWK